MSALLTTPSGNLTPKCIVAQTHSPLGISRKAPNLFTWQRWANEELWRVVITYSEATASVLGRTWQEQFMSSSLTHPMPSVSSTLHSFLLLPSMHRGSLLSHGAQCWDTSPLCVRHRRHGGPPSPCSPQSILCKWQWAIFTSVSHTKYNVEAGGRFSKQITYLQSFLYKNKFRI